MSNPRETYLKIKRLAEHGATPGEREAAKNALTKMYAKYRSSELETVEMEQGRVEVTWQHNWERNLIQHVAHYLDVEVHCFADGHRRTTRILRGPTHLVELAADLYHAHRAILKARIFQFTLGYNQGAMPVTLKSSDRKPDPQEAEAAKAGLFIGRANQRNMKRLKETTHEAMS